jgi:IS1 family transposase
MLEESMSEKIDLLKWLFKYKGEYIPVDRYRKFSKFFSTFNKLNRYIYDIEGYNSYLRSGDTTTVIFPQYIPNYYYVIK